MTQSRFKAERISAVARWSDIQLPPDQLTLLRDIAAQVAPRSTDHDEPEVHTKPDPALGIGVLFSGEGGTGKRLAAEVLAEDLHLPLYRVDLSQVESKYIRETEKNLERVFDAAEAAGAILLLDEADELFGKRSEAEDSRDTDIDVAYVLERLENHPGLVILATRSRSALDPAFIRRLRFVVDFPLPTSRPTDDRAAKSPT